MITPGFEETGKELFVSDAAHFASCEYLRHLPARIFPPGTTPLFQLWNRPGGYVVQRISGKPFEQYVRKTFTAP